MAWVREHLDDPDLRIIDARWSITDPGGGGDAYRRGHIPGAVFLDLETELTGPEGPGRHPLPDLDGFVDRLAALGVGTDHTVVVYDESSGASAAARCWWLLRHLGHPAVGVLDGGLAAWQASGGPVSDEVPEWPRAAFAAAPREGDTIDAGALLARLGTVTLIDVRDPERYTGANEPIDPVGGHIPTARNAPYAANTNPHGGFRSVGELRAAFQAVGAAPDDQVVVYCGSGVTACHTVLALEHAGFPDVLLYPGSWSDWSSEDRPMATGPEPGAHDR